MTLKSEIINDENYIPILDHGFVGLVDVMGNDSSIVQAARTSYGKGTKSISEDRSLIRYLMRHQHTSVFEMVEFKFHLKMPIFIMRQHVRHRTASLNEYSGRYSIMTDEFYIPDTARLQAQSKTNNQGSGEQLQGLELEMAYNTISRVSNESYVDYLSLANEPGGRDYSFENRKGLSRELARIILPVNNYTELYWKINLKNLLNYIKLRSDSHAQEEIQIVSNALASFVKKICPIAWEAFEDYSQNSINLSSMNKALLDDIMKTSVIHNVDIKTAFKLLVGLESKDDISHLCKTYKLSIREYKEFKDMFNF